MSLILFRGVPQTGKSQDKARCRCTSSREDMELPILRYQDSHVSHIRHMTHVMHAVRTPSNVHAIRISYAFSFTLPYRGFRRWRTAAWAVARTPWPPLATYKLRLRAPGPTHRRYLSTQTMIRWGVSVHARILCACVCMYVCMYVCMCARSSGTRFHLCACVCMHVCMYVCVYVCVQALRVQGFTSVHVYVCMYVCMCVCMYASSSDTRLRTRAFPRYSEDNQARANVSVCTCLHASCMYVLA
jgi:hypothetical protein